MWELPFAQPPQITTAQTYQLDLINASLFSLEDTQSSHTMEIPTTPKKQLSAVTSYDSGLPSPPLTLSTPVPSQHQSTQYKSALPSPDITLAKTAPSPDYKPFGQHRQTVVLREPDEGVPVAPRSLAPKRVPTRVPGARVGLTGRKPLNRRVRTAIKLIEKIRDHKYKRLGGEVWEKTKLYPSELDQLYDFIKDSKDETLRSFFYDKLR